MAPLGKQSVADGRSWAELLVDEPPHFVRKRGDCRHARNSYERRVRVESRCSRVQFTAMPTALTSAAWLAIYFFMYAANSDGGMSIGSAPSLAMRSCMSGVYSARCVSGAVVSGFRARS